MGSKANLQAIIKSIFPMPLHIFLAPDVYLPFDEISTDGAGGHPTIPGTFVGEVYGTEHVDAAKAIRSSTHPSGAMKYATLL